ncbi:hypothetical protein ES703_72383 [subsurface metagenome]
MRKSSIKLNRLWSLTVGVVGGYLLFLALAPVLLSGRNSDVIGEWRDIILQWTQFTGYLRLAFVAGVLIIASVGLLGVVINFLKPYTGQKLMLWGGISSLALLLALWLGLLDLHVPIFGSTDVGSHLIWDGSWGIASWSVSKKIFHFFGGGWLKPAFAGAILLILTSLPRWWSRLR